MGFLRLLESIRIPALNVFFSGITYCGDEIAFMVVAFALFWCVNKRTGYYAFLVGLFGTVDGLFHRAAQMKQAEILMQIAALNVILFHGRTSFRMICH